MSNVVKLEPAPVSNRLRCTGCGATATAPCDCGVPYELLRPRVAAEIGLKQTPQLPNTAIAQRMGISETTVRDARRQIREKNERAVETPEPEESFWTPEKEAEIMRMHREGKGDTEIADAFGITRGAASGKKHRLMLLRPDFAEKRMPPEMPEDIYRQVVVLAGQAGARLHDIDRLSAYVEQMHEDLRHEIANEVKSLHVLSTNIIKRLVGRVADIKRPAACGVTFKIHKED